MKEYEADKKCDTHGVGRGFYRVLFGRSVSKRPLGVGERITLR
jgi:hypothetical protein